MAGVNYKTFPAKLDDGKMTKRTCLALELLFVTAVNKKVRKLSNR